MKRFKALNVCSDVRTNTQYEHKPREHLLYECNRTSPPCYSRVTPCPSILLSNGWDDESAISWLYERTLPWDELHDRRVSSHSVLDAAQTSAASIFRSSERTLCSTR